MTAEQDRKISDAVTRERSRLRNFIASRVPQIADAEDILQDVFAELVEAVRFLEPIEQIGAWLFRVARNRIIDRGRKRAPDQTLDELLPAPGGGPDADYVRGVLLDELQEALDELPAEQREVFIAHEFEERSFKEIAAQSGVSINTLLSRKHYAVTHLRKRLRAIYEEMKETS